MCRHALKRAARKKKPDKSRELDQLHVDFLTNPETLRVWAGRSMKERAILFHRKFPNKRIAVTSLRRLYLRKGIKRKVVRQEKIKPAHVQLAFDANRRKLLQQL